MSVLSECCQKTTILYNISRANSQKRIGNGQVQCFNFSFVDFLLFYFAFFSYTLFANRYIFDIFVNNCCIVLDNHFVGNNFK